IEEIKQLLTQNIFEINLIGQDLAAFGFEKSFSDPFVTENKAPLYFLLHEISKLSGDFWIRLLYIHPDHFPHEILEILQADNRILPYFDIPFQHANEIILKKMNRKGNFEKYHQLILDIKEALPNTILRTTFLVGFPGETDENFHDCINFLHAVQPHYSGSFTYSKEEDTPAYSFKPLVPKKIAQKRKTILEDLQDSISETHLQNRKGKIYTVLVEEILPPNDETDSNIIYALGRCWFQAPDVDGVTVVRYAQSNKNAPHIIPGARIKAEITQINGSVLQALLVNPDEKE
ncbi:MAG: radical SAM protein, partial [Treponemataceae bacterium]